MKNSTGAQIRKYIAGGILSIAAVFGGALGSTGMSFAAPADGWDPIAPAVDAPVRPTPIAPAQADGWDPIAPALDAPVAPVRPTPIAPAPAAPVAPADRVDAQAPVGPSSKAPGSKAPAMNAPVRKAPASGVHAGKDGNSRGEGHSSSGRSR